MAPLGQPGTTHQTCQLEKSQDTLDVRHGALYAQFDFENDPVGQSPRQRRSLDARSRITLMKVSSSDFTNSKIAAI